MNFHFVNNHSEQKPKYGAIWPQKKPESIWKEE
jgi:hypothetical protein